MGCALASLRFAAKTTGNVVCILLLTGTAMLAGAVETTGRTAVCLVSFLCGCKIDQLQTEVHSERYDALSGGSTVEYIPGSIGFGAGALAEILDEKTTLANSQKALFGHFSEVQLIDKTKYLLQKEFGCLEPDLLAEDFQFLFPVVGPLPKEEFVDAFGGFKVKQVFPSACANYWNFSVDPMEPNRVWFFSKAVMPFKEPTKADDVPGNLQKLLLGTRGLWSIFACLGMPRPPAEIRTPPQIMSVSFDENGKCYKLTGGYCADRTSGNTSNLGGIFGPLNAVRPGLLPFPEARPWSPSLTWEALILRAPQIGKDYKTWSHQVFGCAHEEVSSDSIDRGL
ncbi:unnamed protein product [Polarella glacialis]|uniref:Phospholipase B-like n=1 Tax=Polarella glacialis TaxID=89957 RepID=A0A813K752_POLGL|nr:unnamed protein product [Polarella glacialis]CAE8696474.1 unnamed protein product [Polarella glacialis]